MSKARKELESSLNKLAISPQNQKKTSTPQNKKVVVDSWEDDDVSSGEETDRPLTAQVSADYPAAPPPTPISPTIPSDGNGFFVDNWNSPSNGGASPRGERNNVLRPEKTDAVAKRMIAGALGVKAPKKTEEQRAYDRAIKEKEMRKRNTEKETRSRAEEEAARAKAAAWDG